MRWEEGIEDSWSGVAEEVMSEIREWREQHAKATFREIEEAVDRLMAKARARFIQDVALASGVRSISREGEDDRPPCPRCGGRLESRGRSNSGG